MNYGRISQPCILFLNFKHKGPRPSHNTQVFPSMEQRTLHFTFFYMKAHTLSCEVLGLFIDIKSNPNPIRIHSQPIFDQVQLQANFAAGTIRFSSLFFWLSSFPAYDAYWTFSDVAIVRAHVFLAGANAIVHIARQLAYTSAHSVSAHKLPLSQSFDQP